jgi:hypothetical protein
LQLLDCIFDGILYCGYNPTDDQQLLLGGYLNHLDKLIVCKYHELFNNVLLHIMNGTDTASLSPLCWKELHSFSLQSSTDVQNDTLHLGLQLTLEAIRSLTSHYSQKRLSNKVQ